MKRITALFLAALLILAAVPALAAPDPIVGVWYLDVDSSQEGLETLRKSFAHSLWIYIIAEDGQIYRILVKTAPDNTPAEPAAVIGPTLVGSWEKTADGYQLHGWATDPAHVGVHENALVIPLSNVENYYTFHRFGPMTPYDVWPAELMQQMQP